MKINEILDSTQSWSSIAGVDVTISDEFQQKYRRIIQTMKMVGSLRNVIPYDIWMQSVTSVVSEAQEFSALANNYITSVERLSIKNDPDLNTRLRKVKRMKMQIANYLDHLIT